ELGYGRFVFITNNQWDVMRITKWVLAGYPLQMGEPLGGVVENAASVEAYGARGDSFDSPYIERVRPAKDMADWFVARFAEPIPAVRSVTVVNKADGVDNLDQLTHGVGDVLRVIDYQTAHDRRYLIVGEEHVIDVPNNTHQTTWYLEPAMDWRIMVLNQGLLNRDRLLY
ncbi:MAG: hypothetical protein H5T84_00725, partial [Thermoleophilia bacterium]|nr:hypothetical protein [Thermoleophilia bacterium]